ncbi:MAG TPA: hypothetical protein VLX90_02855, partial [Steroidobacteraceae bacterium]|nr:hypothetical protein [Steroidobacteraceae bacterium]
RSPTGLLRSLPDNIQALEFGRRFPPPRRGNSTLPPIKIVQMMPSEAGMSFGINKSILKSAKNEPT